jgi:hypothetical protein
MAWGHIIITNSWVDVIYVAKGYSFREKNLDTSTSLSLKTHITRKEGKRNGGRMGGRKEEKGRRKMEGRKEKKTFLNFLRKKELRIFPLLGKHSTT